MSTTTAHPATPATVAARRRTPAGSPVASRNIACDRCPTARAKVHVSLAEGREVYLCGHHYRENREALSAVALSIVEDDPKDSYWLPEEAR